MDQSEGAAAADETTKIEEQATAQEQVAETQEEPKAPAPEKTDGGYKETDVFAWANNLVQYKDELKVELFLFNKNYVVYRTARARELEKQMEPIFIDGLLENVLEGAEQGMIVRGFEDAEAETNVLQRTTLSKVENAKMVLNWVKTQEHEIETFVEEEHDIKRIKGVLARVTHADMDKPFYVVKALQQSQIMKGKTGWMIKDNKFVPFDAEAALRFPTDNQLLILDQDIYVFNQAKLKSLFGYDAKEASIAESKIREIEENFKLSFSEGNTLQSLIKGKKGAIKKLQKIEPSTVKQEDLVDHAEDLDVGLMTDDNGAIIIMDDKDVDRFVNLLNDDYIESPMTGLRYEIKSKKLLKPADEEELLKQFG